MQDSINMGDAIEELQKRMAETTGSNENKLPEPVDPNDFETEEVEEEDYLSEDTTTPMQEYLPPQVGPGLAASAAGIASSISVLLSFFGRKAYAKAILEEGDAEAIAAIQAQVSQAPQSKQEDLFNNLVNQSPEVLGAYGRSLEFTEAIKGLPLTDKEEENLTRVLGNLLGHYNVQPGPWGDMAIVAITIAIPRLGPLMPNVGKMLEKMATR
jgi:hypothetical protein